MVKKAIAIPAAALRKQLPTPAFGLPLPGPRHQANGMARPLGFRHAGHTAHFWASLFNLLGERHSVEENLLGGKRTVATTRKLNITHLPTK